MTRVLVTRAKDEAERTAEKLRVLGFTPLISPVLEIVATGAAIPRETFDAGLATSARAVVLADGGLAALPPLPFYVVGARTAQALEARGLRVAATAADIASLVALLQEQASPLRFLYLAGHDRKGDLERSLRESGHIVTTVETYEARATLSLSDEALAALSRGEIAAVLHYSARSAAIFLELASDLPSSGGTNVTHLALSEDIARVLRDAGCADVRAAQAPDEESLLRLLREP